MNTYHVTYYYLATGMEGHADEQDYGYVEAYSSEEAKDIAAKRRHPRVSQTDLNWIKGCLTARKVRT